MGPAARRIVAEHGLDPTAIEGSGKDGRITKADALRHLEAPPAGDAGATPGAGPAPEAEPRVEPTPSPPSTAKPVAPPEAPLQARSGTREERREPMSRLRRRVAERLLEAQRNAAILTTFNEVDMQPAMDLRRRYRTTSSAATGYGSASCRSS